jgi:hypothetical protein
VVFGLLLTEKLTPEPVARFANAYEVTRDLDATIRVRDQRERTGYMDIIPTSLQRRLGSFGGSLRPPERPTK